MASPDREADLSDRLRTERVAKGMSLTELGRRADLSKAYLSQLEAGRQANPSLDVLRRIADALDITIARLVGGEGVRASSLPRAMEDPGLEAFVADRMRQGQPIPEADFQLLLRFQWRGGRSKRSREEWATMYAVIRQMWDKREE